jgi:hypothetical protein
VDPSSGEQHCVSESTFMYIPNLVLVPLANSKKLMFPDNTPFLQNKNLRVLHLENCGLYRISHSSFVGVTNHCEIYLSYTK